MNLKYEVGQEVVTNVRVTETISSIEINSHGAIYHTRSGKVYPEMVLSSIENKPIAPKPDEPKEAVTLYCFKENNKNEWGIKVTPGKLYEFGVDGYIQYDEIKSTHFDSFEAWKHGDFNVSKCLIRAEKRPALVGEWVLILKTNQITFGDYHTGDILKAIEVDERGYIQDYGVKDGVSIWLEEYLVLPDYVPEKVEPTYYSGKVVCVDTCGSSVFTQGKVYSFENGVVTSNNGTKYNRLTPYKTLHGFNENCVPQFIPYLDEQS